VGFEYVGEAVERATENAGLNGIGNAEFHAGDVRDLLGSVTGDGGNAGTVEHPQVVVVDPPRAGVHPDVITELLRIRPDQIIYVSCKPSTQARDLARLAESYEITRIQPVDMFPHTFHIENVVDMKLRGDRQ
jgi:23S rRNA (uracil1939-C5)-methyltransferase